MEQVPPKGVSDSPYKKFAIRRALQEEGISASAASIATSSSSTASNTSTISSRINTLNGKVDTMISLLQQLVDK